MPPPQVRAEFLGRRNEGSVTPGKVASVIVLDKNPLEDIRNTQSIRAVIIRGRLLDRATLDDMLAGVERSAQNSR